MGAEQQAIQEVKSPVEGTENAAITEAATDATLVDNRDMLTTSTNDIGEEFPSFGELDEVSDEDVSADITGRMRPGGASSTIEFGPPGEAEVFNADGTVAGTTGDSQLYALPPGEGQMQQQETGPEQGLNQLNQMESMMSAESEVLPGQDRFDDADSKVDGAWTKAFRENQPEYREGIREADEHLAEKAQEYDQRMEKDGLGDKEIAAREEIGTKSDDVQDNLDNVPLHSHREQYAKDIGQYLTDRLSGADPAKSQAVLDQMRENGHGDLADSLEALGDSVVKHAPTLGEASELRTGLRNALENSMNLRSNYGDDLGRAADNDTTSDAQREIDDKETATMSRERSQLLLKHGFKAMDVPLDLRFHVKPPSGGPAIDA